MGQGFGVQSRPNGILVCNEQANYSDNFDINRYEKFKYRRRVVELLPKRISTYIVEIQWCKEKILFFIFFSVYKLFIFHTVYISFSGFFQCLVNKKNNKNNNNQVIHKALKFAEE